MDTQATPDQPPQPDRSSLTLFSGSIPADAPAGQAEMSLELSYHPPATLGETPLITLGVTPKGEGTPISREWELAGRDTWADQLDAQLGQLLNTSGDSIERINLCNELGISGCYSAESQSLRILLLQARVEGRTRLGAIKRSGR